MEHRFSFFIILMHHIAAHFMCLAFLVFYDPQRQARSLEDDDDENGFFLCISPHNINKYATTKKVLHASRH